jgi:hypothetical protein
MTLPEVIYAELEIIRQSHIVDDERIDLRLLERFTHSARGTFIKGYLDTSKENIEETLQNLEVPLSLISDRDKKILRTTSTIPSIMDTRFGLSVSELYSPSNLLLYPFVFVSFDRLRSSGNGYFNSNSLFGAYRDNYIYLTSKNDTYKLLENIGIRAVFNDPTKVTGYIKETSTYPINEVIFQYIKDTVIKTDIRLLMGGISDEVSDNSGKIE